MSCGSMTQMGPGVCLQQLTRRERATDAAGQGYAMVDHQTVCLIMHAAGARTLTQLEVTLHRQRRLGRVVTPSTSPQGS